MSTAAADSAERIALFDLVCRYAQAVDRRDFTALAELFTEDIRLHLPHLEIQAEGRAQVVACISPIADMYEKTFHTVHNQLVEVKQGMAQGETYCVARHFRQANGAPQRYDMGIRYQDRFRRENGVWRICLRELLLDWEETRNLSAQA